MSSAQERLEQRKQKILGRGKNRLEQIQNTLYKSFPDPAATGDASVESIKAVPAESDQNPVLEDPKANKTSSNNNRETLLFKPDQTLQKDEQSEEISGRQFLANDFTANASNSDPLLNLLLQQQQQQQGTASEVKNSSEEKLKRVLTGVKLIAFILIGIYTSLNYTTEQLENCLLHHSGCEELNPTAASTNNYSLSILTMFLAVQVGDTLLQAGLTGN